jgi:hypothetical protein
MPTTLMYRNKAKPRKANPMSNATLLIWWFAVVAQGHALFFEYRSIEACKIVQRSYEKVITHGKVTPCYPKGNAQPVENRQAQKSENAV